MVSSEPLTVADTHPSVATSLVDATGIVLQDVVLQQSADALAPMASPAAGTSHASGLVVTPESGSIPTTPTPLKAVMTADNEPRSAQEEAGANSHAVFV